MKRFAWWRARRRRKAAAAAVCLSVLFVAVNVVLALGQWDPGRTVLRPGTSLELSLERGDRRIVYLGAAETGYLSFDFYPSDFACSAVSPLGAVVLEPVDQLRLLNVWENHRAVGSFEAPATGLFELSCRGPGVELLVARPERFRVGWASPQFAMLIATVVVVVAVGALLVDMGAGRLRRPRADDSEHVST